MLKKWMNLQNNKLDSKKKEISRLINGTKESMYVSKCIAIKFMIQSNSFNTKKKQSVVAPLLNAFSTKKIELWRKILENERIRTDMYFPEHKFVAEIDEKGHIDRNQNKKSERQTKIEKHPNWKFLHRVNPDVEGFDVFVENSKIKNCIKKSNENKMKSKFAKELLNYISSLSKPLKHIRYFAEKILSTL